MSDLNMDALAESHYAAQDPQFEPEISLNEEAFLEDLQDVYEKVDEAMRELSELIVEHEITKGLNRNLDKAYRKLGKALELIEREL